MAAATFISTSEYLNTTYRPDCDYINGEVRERNFGEQPHAFLQGLLSSIFYANRHTWAVLGALELTLQIAPDRFRIADIAVLRRTDPQDPIVRVAPLICIEVLSPRDTLIGMQDRVDDYIRMGVEHIWVIDPLSRHAYIATAAGFLAPANDEFIISGTPIRISLAEAFAELDDMQTPG